MTRYVPQNGDWAQAPPRDTEPPYVELTKEPPTVRFVGDGDTSFHLSGAPARSDTETVHTVAIVAPSFTDGTTLCALRAEDSDLTVEDRRPGDARTLYSDAFEHLQSALDEILILVYIDDAIEEVSETVDGFLVIHTVQHEDGRDAPHTYFRTAVFQNGDLLLEAEDGTL